MKCRTISTAKVKLYTGPVEVTGLSDYNHIYEIIFTLEITNKRIKQNVCSLLFMRESEF